MPEYRFIKILKQYLSGLINLIFPRNCLSCEQLLLVEENYLCLDCESELAITYWWRATSNPLFCQLSARCGIELAYAYYQFHKNSPIRQLLHAIKYENQQKLALQSGRLFGFDLEACIPKANCCLIPVPLHPKKRRKRGYNQAYLIARGLGESLSIPVNENLLKRCINTKTQTKKSRADRWKNVSSAFTASKCDYEFLLIVDDVATTGATLEACIYHLRKANPQAKFGVLTLAWAP